MSQQIDKIRALKFWKSEVTVEPISGGITNQNFLVNDAGRKHFVRIGKDIPIHGVMRFNELAASMAAHKAGISPAVLYAEPGVMVLDYIEGQALTAEDVRDEQNLSRVIELLKICHNEMPALFEGPALVFWVFQVVRGYANTLNSCGSAWIDKLNELQAIAAQLENDVGKIDLVLGHNDLLCGNFVNDGIRLWLIDWDYAGFNSPLFDLGGLASNNGFDADLEACLLERYFLRPPDTRLYKQYSAMKCASLLREAMWSMVSEHYSEIDFDYRQYTQENLALFQQAWRAHQQQYT